MLSVNESFGVFSYACNARKYGYHPTSGNGNYCRTLGPHTLCKESSCPRLQKEESPATGAERQHESSQ